MFLVDIETGAIGSIPNVDGSIITGGGKTAAIGRLGNIAHTLAVPTVGEEDS